MHPMLLRKIGLQCVKRGLLCVKRGLLHVKKIVRICRRTRMDPVALLIITETTITILVLNKNYVKINNK